MSHPFEAILKEFQVAIDHLVPTVPEDVKAQMEQSLAALRANPNASEEEVRAALAAAGRAEFPYRRAYQELQGTAEAELSRAFVLDHVDPPVREKLKGHLDAGVPLEEVVRSALFETEFTPEERYQVEHGILDAKAHVQEEGVRVLAQREEEYSRFVEKWRVYAVEVEKKIAELEAMAAKDSKWKDEILGRVARFREGFLLTERDPEREEVKKEIEYWKGVFGEEL